MSTAEAILTFFLHTLWKIWTADAIWTFFCTHYENLNCKCNRNFKATRKSELFLQMPHLLMHDSCEQTETSHQRRAGKKGALKVCKLFYAYFRLFLLCCMQFLCSCVKIKTYFVIFDKLFGYKIIYGLDNLYILKKKCDIPVSKILATPLTSANGNVKLLHVNGNGNQKLFNGEFNW
jgi:hypothetical protein